MSGYTEAFRDHHQANWVAKWVPEDDGELPPMTMQQYRFTMARARAAESELKLYKSVLSEMKGLMMLDSKENK